MHRFNERLSSESLPSGGSIILDRRQSILLEIERVRARMRRAKGSNYSYLNASTGSSFDAFNAGIIPLNTPTKSSTTADPNTAIAEMRK